ncbi:MAG: hypothetical protein HQL60_00870 [Magnetococcales bacterium]|nr:hypothetical protein [Magnetococcales bacterium]
MNNRSAKKGEWVVTVGLFFLIGVVIAALFPDWFSRPYVGSFAQSVPQAQLGPQTVLVPIQGQPAAAQMIPVVATQQTAAKDPQPGLVLLQQAPRVNFKGSVQQVSEQPQSDGQLHLWLQDANGVESQVSVGPGWFLQYLGCPLAHDVAVSGAGFTFQKAGANPLIYAKRIEINGKVCQLRNDEGFALWSNKLR